MRSHKTYFIVPDSIPEPIDDSECPKVSFCIPTKNRERTIEACLESIRAQQYPHVEIIVVDNGSTDRTIEIAQRYADKVVSCSGALGAVRQQSIDESTGTILAIFDDDIVIPHIMWLKCAVAAFQLDSQVSTVWPVLIPPSSATWVTLCFFDLNEAIFMARKKRTTAVFGGGNSLFRRSAIEKIGGFDTSIGFGEDFDLASRLKSAGFSVILHKDPLIHDTMYSIREIYRKQKWGAHAVQTRGPELLAQSYTDAAQEQFIVGTKAMIKGLIIERKPWWIAYPLLVGAKTIPYMQAAIRREWATRKSSVAQ